MESAGPEHKKAETKNMFEVYVEEAIMENGERTEVLDHMDQL